MSYSVASRGNVTMIDDLPELSDVEQGYQGGHGPQNYGPPRGHPPNIPEGVLSPEMAQKLQRHVRNTRTVLNPEAGMSAYGHGAAMAHEAYEPREQIEHMAPPGLNPLTGISCLDFNQHVTQCPICSRFYNTDRSVYIIIIVVLTIVCLLLLKRVLDV